ncbi:MAG TPA: metallophosphoesterase [Synergistaceae bacterium]|nr:metallophosphoesterase [Synergistaceae bacterium]
MKRLSLVKKEMQSWARRAHVKIAEGLPFLGVPGAVFRKMRLQHGQWLLHVSDTPTCFYGPLKQLVALVDPKIIVHTGDLADEVKIGLCRKDLPLYARRIRSLAVFLDSPRTYVVIGNHDDFEEVRKAFPRSVLLPESRILPLEGFSVGLSHNVQDLPRERADCYLYGHDDTPPPQEIADICYNGLEHIHCWNFVTGERRFFRYPRYVGDRRSRKFGIGL